MSIYETLTDNFLAARKLLPDPKWNDQIHANIDEHFESVAVSLSANPEILSNLVRSPSPQCKTLVSVSLRP